MIASLRLRGVTFSSGRLLSRLLFVGAFLLAGSLATGLSADLYFVSNTGDDSNPGTRRAPLATIQHALNEADQPGDRVYVRGGTYHEKIVLPHSGSSAGYITILPFQNEVVILDGTGVLGENMVLMEDVSYVRLMNFRITGNTGVTDGSGIRLLGTCKFVSLIDNEIYGMLGVNAMGITVYGTRAGECRRLYLRGNHVHDCEPAPSEAIVVNGNVNRFSIINNLVHDVNNIGIDVIGGETDINPDPAAVARYGVVRNNTVFNARSSYGGGYAAGIYVDGGKYITVDSNEVSQCDLGIEVGAENAGTLTRNVIVKNNLVHDNDKVGIVFGGYASNTGRVRFCRFYNNTVYRNDTLGTYLGQLWISFASDNIVANNIFEAAENDALMYVENGGTNNTLDYNLWFSSDQPEISFGNQYYGSLEDFRATGNAAHSVFANPRFFTPGFNFRLKSNSPAIDAGRLQGGWYGTLDRVGVARPQLKGVDQGAYEFEQ